MIMVEQPIETGLSLIKASEAVWGKTGRRLVIFGLVIIMILFELDNSTISVYSNYSTSEFGALSALGSLNTASTIAFGVVKLPIAKLSNIIGRGYTLAITILLYTISYILMASASDIVSYAAGMVLYKIGQSGTNAMAAVIISDLTSLRWRGLALGASYFPYLITPWVSGFIVDSVVSGIGWRWGIGMFAILMPFGASVIIGTLIHYQHKAKKAGLIAPKNTTIHSFFSDIDLGGVTLFVTGFALFLLPITIAGSLQDGWGTPWIISLIIIGFVILLALPVYEKFVAENPMVPVFFFKNATIVWSMLLIAIDSLSYSCTHTYLYAWAMVSYNMSARDATFFVFANSVTQCLTGIFAGWIMLATGRYKWLVMGGAVVRLIGYGLMIRLQGHVAAGVN
ncbi:major facilitator superfamily domain-containing protein [Xylaria digitata]|nr:major facilitator superfamily domain-containing protein [Xylaria digitata]